MRGVGLRGRAGSRPTQALLGWTLATLIVLVAIFGPPLTGQSIRTMVELRHDVLMINREFERWSVRTNPSAAPTSVLIYDDLIRTHPMNRLPEGRARGGIA
jgi:hypothetical protein